MKPDDPILANNPFQGLPTPDSVAALAAHPHFPDAMLASANGLIAQYQRNYVNWFLDDRARLLIGYLTLYLHFTAEPGEAETGLTVKRMKAMCVELGICSPSRVVAILAFMRFAGYITPSPNDKGGRLRSFVPTSRMLELHRERWASQFSAIGLMLPVGREALSALSRDEFVAAFLKALGRYFRAGFRFLHSAPELEFFSSRTAGMMIFCSMVSAGAEEDTVPPMRPYRFDVPGLGRKFGVSRHHVQKMLRDAEAAGLIVRAGERGEDITHQESFTQAAQRFYASLFLFFAHCARLALAEIGSK